jgi:uncharacterized membrane protein
MHKGRLEAFSDGVIAIIVTIMVLELRPPGGVNLTDLQPLIPVFSSYVLSFIFLGIYWSNHHHMLQAAQHVSGAALWANLHLLFWLSLIPFVTAWMGEHGVKAGPVAAYGTVLMLCGIAYYILTRALIHANGADSAVAKALGKDMKGKLSVVAYAIAIAFTAVSPVVSALIYLAVALVWLVPDRRFERVLGIH